MSEIKYKIIGRKYADALKHLMMTVMGALENPAFFIPYSNAEMNDMFSDDHILVGAFDDKKLVGFSLVVMVGNIGDWDGSMTAPEYRGCGIMSETFRRCMAIARKSGIKKIFARAHPDNIASINGVKKNGFIEKEKTEWDGQPRILFELVL